MNLAGVIGRALTKKMMDSDGEGKGCFPQLVHLQFDALVNGSVPTRFA
jgi:hypothetical protein